MKNRKTWLTRTLACSLALGLLTTSAMATSVDIIIQPSETFSYAGSFNYKDIAQVQDAGSSEYRYVTVENGQLVSAEGDSSTPSMDLYAAQGDDGLWGYNDKEDGSGTMVIPAVYDEVAIDALQDWFDLYVAKENGTWGVYDIDTTNVGVTGITAALYDQDIFYDGVKVQGSDGQWGLVWLQHWGDLDYLTVPMSYDDVMGDDYLDGVDVAAYAYWVKSGTNASVVGSVWGDDGYEFTTIFTMDTKYYQAPKDENGDWQNETRFNGDDQLVIRDHSTDDYKYGIINMDGAMVVDFIYDDLSSIGMGMYSAANYGETYACAMMAHDGTLVTDFVYGSLNWFNELGVIAACPVDGWDTWGLVSKTGTAITDYSYSWLNDRSEGMWEAVNGESMSAVLTSDGKLLTDYIYTDMASYRDGLMPVMQGDLYGILDTLGDEVLPVAYDALGKYDGPEDDYFSPYDMGYYTYNWIGQLDEAGVMKLGVIQNNYDVTVEEQSTTLVINGVSQTVGAYATKDSAGNYTNYYKLRDIASLLDGSSAQFNVDWYGQVAIEVGDAYVANGTEMSVPFTGTQVGDDKNADTIIDNTWTELDTITLTDASGNGYTYYKLRDLGSAIGFTVGWDSATASITVTTP